MPDYLVTDPATGRTLKMSGPTRPSAGMISTAFRAVPMPSHAPQALQTSDPMQAAAKAQTIGPSRVGERYQEPLNPDLVDIARNVMGGAVRPRSVAAADPYGIQAWLQGNGPMPAPIAAEIKAYHGSPHDFERFLMDKIGTGEGAQAYGHGLYFAENPAVAQEYKKALADFEVHEPSGKIVGGGGPTQTYKGTPSDRALAWVQDAASRTDIADPFGSAYAWANRGLGEDDPHKAEILQQLLDWRKSGAQIKPGGRMYEVAIKAHPEQFLDWDKPLSQQPEAVRYILGYQPPPTQHEIDAMFALAKSKGVAPTSLPEYQALQVRADVASKFDQDYPSGRKIYNQLMNDQRDVAIRNGRNADTTLPAAQSLASKELRDLGIPGIKYLDQGSRAQPYRGDPAYLHAAKSFLTDGQSANDALSGLKATYKTANPIELQQAVNETYGTTQGTHNYVVFDDKLIDILKKYAVIPPALAVSHGVTQQGLEDSQQNGAGND